MKLRRAELKNKEHPWIVLSAISKAFECLHCGASQPMAFPCTFTEMGLAADSFAEEHIDCPNPDHCDAHFNAEAP